MWIVMLIPVVLSLLLLGAHFLRHQHIVPLAICVIALGLAAVPRRWAARVVQVILILGAIEWVRTTVTLAMQRHEAGESWTRMVIILGVVTLITAGSAVVFESPRLRRRYRGAGCARA